MFTEKKRSAVEKILADKGVRIEFLTIQNEEGKDFFAYILMSEADYPKYQEALKTGMVDPDEHGAVIAYGEGKTPPDDLKKMINELLN